MVVLTGVTVVVADSLCVVVEIGALVVKIVGDRMVVAVVVVAGVAVIGLTLVF